MLLFHPDLCCSALELPVQAVLHPESPPRQSKIGRHPLDFTHSPSTSVSQQIQTQTVLHNAYKTKHNTTLPVFSLKTNILSKMLQCYLCLYITGGGGLVSGRSCDPTLGSAAVTEIPDPRDADGAQLQ